jgi:hypothetical protein
MPDIDMTPATGQLYDEEGAPKLLTEVYPLTIDPATKRLRVDIEASPLFPQIVKGQPRTCFTLADNAIIAIGAMSAVAQFAIGCGVPGSGKIAIAEFGIHVSIPLGGAGAGDIYIQYRPTEGAGAWRTYEVIPLVVGLKIEKTLIPTMPEYYIFYLDGGAGTNPLDLFVTLKPQT